MSAGTPKQVRSLDNSSEFKTPTSKKAKTDSSEARTPMQIPPSPLLEKLGYGTGVSIFKLNRKPAPSGAAASPWAVKRLLNQSKTNTTLAARLEQEAKILEKLSHPNIVGFRGMQKQADGRLCLAMEEGGQCLMDLIEKRKEEIGAPFPAKTIAKVALDIAKAIAYLHDEHKLVHGDIKSQNMLIKGDFEVAKLCDFGTSLPIGPDGVVQGEYHCSEPWSAPEVVDFFSEDEEEDLPEKSPITSKADIFSFGLVIYEMLTLTTPHFNFDFDDSTASFDEDSFYNRIGNRPDLPNLDYDSSYNDILSVFYSCTEEDDDMRPTAAKVVEILSTCV